MCSFKMRSFIVATLLFCVSLRAATIIIKNESSSPLSIRVADKNNGAFKACSNEGDSKLMPGAEYTCGSGTETPALISWFGDADRNDYVAEINLWNLNVGARFFIRDGGKYNYEFGIDGSGYYKDAKVWECKYENKRPTCIKVPKNWTSKP